MPKFQIDNRDTICWRAINGEIDLIEAANELLDFDYGLEEPYTFFHHEAEILEEMLAALAKNPKHREAILRQYKDAALQVFTNLLDQLTAPDIPYAPNKRYPLPRSAPQDRTES